MNNHGLSLRIGASSATVGELRSMIDGMADDAHLVIDGGEALPVVRISSTATELFIELGIDVNDLGDGAWELLEEIAQGRMTKTAIVAAATKHVMGQVSAA